MPVSFPPQAHRVFQGDTFSVWQWDQKLFDASHATFEGIGRPDYACALGILPDRRLLVVEDTQPHREAVITLAGGQVESGESAAAAARRELLEETGYTMDTLVAWHAYQPNSKIYFQVHMFVARGIRQIQEPHLEAGEKIRLLTYSFDEFLELGHNPLVRDMWLRITLLEAKLDPVKRSALESLLYG